MGYQKFKRPLLSPRFKSFAAGSTSTPFLQGKQKPTITVTSTATILPETGTVILNFAGDKSARLPTPVAGGRVTVSAIKSTAINTVTTKTTAETFFGSTYQNIAFTTAQIFRSATLEVVGPSTGLKWSVVAKSTGATLS
jgi:hypothetical protein